MQLTRCYRPSRMGCYYRASPAWSLCVPDVILRLALPSPLRRLFDYLAPPGVSARDLQPGARLRVPFGRREMIGVLIEISDHSEVPAGKLKPALQLLDLQAPVPPALMRLCQWTAQYYPVSYTHLTLPTKA